MTSRKIIVIDDSQSARFQLRTVLEPLGYTLVEAVDGRDGLRKMQEHPETRLVFCDVNMPFMDGLQMLEAAPPLLRLDRTFVMVTTETDPLLMQRAKELGARGWIVKPFKPEMLVGTVRKILG